MATYLRQLAAQTQQIIVARNVRLAVVDVAKALGGGWDVDARMAASMGR